MWPLSYSRWAARMVRLAAVGVVLGLCVLSAGLGGVTRSEVGRYVLASALIAGRQYGPALQMTESLVDDYPTANWHYYRIKAQVLRYLGRHDESLARGARLSALIDQAVASDRARTDEED